MKKSFILYFILVLIGIPCFVQASNTLEDSGIDYTEIATPITNPERGFYSTMPIKCTKEGTPVKNSDANLIHMRIGIGDFSKAQNGVEDIDFTDSMLEALNQTFENIRKNGGMAIIRFSYDDFEGNSNMEPTIEKIVRHIEQLQPLFEKNEDIIVCVESGFIGPWGEQHSSVMATEENFNKIIEALLKSVPKTRTINVRKPQIYVNYAGIKQEDIQNDIPKKEDKTYRIGIFNDGYLGSESDLGTYKNRDKEIKWLSNQAKHTYFGGEVVANYSTDGYQYNSASHMIKEMFLTHTSYLNQEWNGTVIKEWKNTQYNGTDKIYQGMNAWEYINNHLGYRLVIRNMKQQKQVYQGEELPIVGKIENVGAGNIINEKEATILLKQGDAIHSYITDLDVRTWNSEEVTDIALKVEIPKDLPVGEWEVYLKIANPGTSLEDNKRCIQFANKDIWNAELGANKLGDILVSEKKEEQKPDDNQKPDEDLKPDDNQEPDVDLNPDDNQEPDVDLNPDDNGNQEEDTNGEDNQNPNGSTDFEKPTNDEKSEKEDKTTASANLPKTGENHTRLFVLILIGLGIIFHLYRRIRKNRI